MENTFTVELQMQPLRKTKIVADVKFMVHSKSEAYDVRNKKKSEP